MSGFSGGGVDNTAWTFYTPTVTSVTRTITTVNQLGSTYKRIGKAIVFLSP
ncbi:hypothetical protein JQ609_19975 [Bradyrhizobium sp. AUGA SZCCT0169]|uniref:hypothetical protein n=1 Tax=Bradyrhizobium sp. AUGA SZCCT0169 TaxID=2807663 RepID=UPI001BAB2761|nr:hypothetical protein [Bradyrhizobium sp. AUGA SZCCT0169]MBR1249193.1 hypothetical protein [Bradyrhizobium sp. AUGA SZCCT0169]